MQTQPTATKSEDLELTQERGLVERARVDRDAFAALYDLYVGRVYRYVLRHAGSHADAEELTAQTFHRASEGMSGFEWRGVPFGAWLFRIAHNLVVDQHRAPSGALSLDQLAVEPPGDAAELADSLELQQDVNAAWSAVATLPLLQQRAVTLRFGRDLSHAEVGFIIGRSEAATKQIVYRAIRTLRQQLESRRDQ